MSTTNPGLYDFNFSYRTPIHTSCCFPIPLLYLDSVKDPPCYVRLSLSKPYCLLKIIGKIQLKPKASIHHTKLALRPFQICFGGCL